MKTEIELRIPDLPLEQKLQLIAETLEAIRQAHRDGMPADCWLALQDTQDALFRATWAARPRPSLTIEFVP